jgi:hypothetical protein
LARAADVITIKTATRLHPRISSRETCLEAIRLRRLGTLHDSVDLSVDDEFEGRWRCSAYCIGSPNGITELIQKNISPIESARVLSKWCSDLPIELEGDDYIALARKVDAAVRAL